MRLFYSEGILSTVYIKTLLGRILREFGHIKALRRYPLEGYFGMPPEAL